jgi:hypothetical protein
MMTKEKFWTNLILLLAMFGGVWLLNVIFGLAFRLFGVA